MKNKKENHAPITHKPKTACELYREMFSTVPEMREETIGGGVNVGMSSGGNAVFVPNPSRTITSYDQNTNVFIKAKYACKEGMLVSPLSTNRYTLFVRREDYEEHAQRAALEQKNALDMRNKNPCMIQ